VGCPTTAANGCSYMVWSKACCCRSSTVGEKATEGHCSRRKIGLNGRLNFSQSFVKGLLSSTMALS
jgi:hypothetical protein